MSVFTIDHSQVTKFLKNLTTEKLINIGSHLGLNYSRLTKSDPKSLMNEMVHCWLQKDDYVMKVSGEPRWESLIKVLKECGHNGIASKIQEAGVIGKVSW